MQVGSVEAGQAIFVTPINGSGNKENHADHIRETDAVALNKEQVLQMVDDMKICIKRMNVSIQFSTYGDHGEKMAITVANKETGEVIREIPPKEIRNLYARMTELAGIIFDKEA
jgi:flagellar protein FlaG